MERFWSKVDKNGPLILETRCWIWTGFKTREGYGKCNLKGLSQYSTRAAWELTNGPIPKGLLTCHKCDNPSCIRPSHVFLGTDADNRRDCSIKKRCYRGGVPPILLGEMHQNHKLTVEEVLEIRAAYTGKYGEMTAFGKKYGVGRSAIYRVIKGDNWKHI